MFPTASSLSKAAQAVPSGCPFAAIWTQGGGFPENSVTRVVEQDPATPITFSDPSNCTASEFELIAKKIIADFGNEGGPDGPGSIRLIFHSAATYTEAGGPGSVGGPDGGWLAFDENLAFPANAGVEDTVEYVKGLKKNYPCITFADAAMLNGAIVSELVGGPAVSFLPGRRDAFTTPKNPVITSRLPDGGFNTAGVTYFYTQMGLTPREMAVYNGGGHSLGGAHAELSGWNGTFTQTGDVFPTPKNQYFRDTFKGKWVQEAVESLDSRNETRTRFQYALVTKDRKGTEQFVTGKDGAHVIRLPSDVSLLFGGGKATEWARTYANDEKLFIADFQRVLQRTSQLGAGRGWQPTADQWEWNGVNGTATNYGIMIPPQE